MKFNCKMRLIPNQKQIFRPFSKGLLKDFQFMMSTMRYKC